MSAADLSDRFAVQRAGESVRIGARNRYSSVVVKGERPVIAEEIVYRDSIVRYRVSLRAVIITACRILRSAYRNLTVAVERIRILL